MSAADRSPARLVLQTPDGQEAVYALEPGRTVTLGRDASNTIVLASQFVSKRHALVSFTPRGVRIEDQDSANGIVVNGLTVHAAQLSNGDVVQLGDQRIVLEMEGHANVPAAAQAAAPGGGNKGLRLALVAVLTLLVMGLVLTAAYLFVLAPAAVAPAGASQATGTTAVAEDTTTPIEPFDSPQAKVVEAQALAAKDRPVDWLYDEGQLAHKNGRLVDAYRLLNGALLRDRSHEPSLRLLRRVMGERNLRLRSFEAAARRAEEEMKFDEAARQWEQVQALTLESEALHAQARAAATRLHQRATP